MSQVLRKLANRQARKIVLVTVNLEGADPSPSNPRHLATQSGSICLSNARDVGVVDDTGTEVERVIEFKPLIARLPQISRKLSIQERRAEIASARVEVLPGSDLARYGISQNATCRIDITTDGEPLSAAIPLLAGRITEAPSAPRITGPITFEALDGDPAKDKVAFNGTITRDAFEVAPVSSIGLPRATIYGHYPILHLCIPLNQEGTLYYVHDGAAVGFPTSVTKGGTRLRADEWAPDVITARDGSEVTVVRLFSPNPNTGLAVGDLVFADGGIGLAEKGVIESLTDLAGIRLSSRGALAARLIGTVGPMSALFNDSIGALSAINERIAPQTQFVPAINLSELDLIDITPGGPSRKVKLGSELAFRIATDTSETPSEFVYTTIEVNVWRNSAGQGTQDKPVFTVIRSPNIGSDAVRRKLAKARSYLGEDRVLTIDAPDLIADLDENTFEAIDSPAAGALADLAASLYYKPHRLHTYKTTNWAAGLSMERGTKFRLTDEREGIIDVPCMVVEQLISDATPPVVTLQEED